MLRKSELNINHDVDILTKIVNFVRAKAPNKRDFWRSIRLKMVTSATIKDATWLSLVKVLQKVQELRTQIQKFVKRNQRTSQSSRILIKGKFM